MSEEKKYKYCCDCNTELRHFNRENLGYDSIDDEQYKVVREEYYCPKCLIDIYIIRRKIYIEDVSDEK